MQKFAKTVASNMIVQAVLSILLGLLLAIWPQITTILVVYILAACLAVSGIASIILYMRGRKTDAGNQGSLLIGLFLLILAIIVFILPEAVTSLFTIIFGAILVLSGLVNVFRSTGMRNFGGSAWIIMLLVSLLLIVGGVVIIINPFDSVVTFVLILGILFIAKGIIDLIISFIVYRSEKVSKAAR